MVRGQGLVALAMLFAGTGCAPRHEPLPCEVVATTQGGEDLTRLYQHHRTPLLIVGQEVLVCSCGGGGLAGASEDRRLAGDSESRALAGDREGRALAGEGEARMLSGDSEGRSLAGDAEGRALAGGSAPPMCVPDGACGYRVQAAGPYQIFDAYGWRWASANECLGT